MPKIQASFGSTVSSFNSTVNNLSKDVTKEIEKAIDEEADVLLRRLKSLTRYRTGNLYRGWRKVPVGSGKGRRFNIINDVSYGVYTTTKTTASRGGEYLEDALNRLIRVHQIRLNRKVKQIVDAARRGFNR